MNNLITLVEIYFNGAMASHKFKGDITEDFMQEINNVGYFARKNTQERLVIINPSNCGSIELIKQHYHEEEEK